MTTVLMRGGAVVPIVLHPKVHHATSNSALSSNNEHDYSAT